MTVLSADTLVTGDAVIAPGWVSCSGGVVEAVGSGAPPSADAHYPLLAPGFVDMHVHGGSGAGYDSPSPDELARAFAGHRAHGTTTTLASLVAAPADDLLRSVELLGSLGVGVHLEGPWLSPARQGAHDPRFLRPPSLAELERLLAPGAVRMITVAPELPGALDLIAEIAAAGVVAAVGHTEADHATTRAALDRGATVGTHLFNAERPVHHREPGPIPALLADPRVVVELIADGVHVHDAMLPFVVSAAGDDRVALVTDAMAATGMPDGPYRLGGLAVTVTDGVARVDSTGSIAGSTATMDVLFGRAARSLGVLSAARLTSANPARALGLTTVGRIATGLAADLVALNAGPGYELIAVPDTRSSSSLS